MKYLQRIVFWLGIIPVVLAFWTFVVAIVHFSDQVALVLDTVTEENIELYDQLIVKVDHLLNLHYPEEE